jgi:hypothetical protein
MSSKSRWERRCPTSHAAEVRGINLCGYQRVDSRDRKQIQRMARYCCLSTFDD